MKIKDLLFGIAIGDAFGAGVEFQDRNWIKENVNFTQFVNVRDKIQVSGDLKDIFTKDYHEWDYTDDTEMTIGVIKALISNNTFNENLLIDKWKEEYYQGIKKKGYGRNGHGSISWYYTGKKSIEEIREFQRNRNNPGNAPAMRAVPLGLVNSALINRYGEINANATHPNINAVIASQCIARATEFLLIKRGNKQNLFSYCSENVALNKEYDLYLKTVNNLEFYGNLKENDYSILCGKQPIEEPYFLPKINGVPSDAKFTTGSILYILKNAETPFEALKMAVNLGGDVDTIASVVTGILSGLTGLDDIPEYMKDNVEGVDYLIEIADKFEFWLNNND